LPSLVGGLFAGLVAVDGGWTRQALTIGIATIVLATPLGWLIPRCRSAPVLAAVALLGLTIGAWRGGMIALPAAVLPSDDPIRVVGVVVEDPNPRGTNLDVLLDQVQLASGAGEREGVSGLVQVSLPRTIPVRGGDRIEALVEFRDPAGLDPGYRERLERRGVVGVGMARTALVLGPGIRGPGASLIGVRQGLLDGLLRLVPEPEASLGAGILLGARSGIDPALSAAFATAGLSHVVAVSGWNVAIVVGLVLAATSRMSRRGAGKWIQAALAVAAIGLYVVMTGATPSVVRAALMATALIFGRLRGSPGHAAGALLAAVALMALANPSVLWDVGFQLSALATAGLIVFAAPLSRRFARWPAWIGEPMALTLAAQLATLPVLIGVFGRLSLIGPLANVAAVPLVPPVMAASALVALMGAVPLMGDLPLIGPLLSWLVGGMAWLSLVALESVGYVAAAAPGAALSIGGPGPWLAAGWYPALGLFALRGLRHAELNPLGDLDAGLPEARLLTGPISRMFGALRSPRAMAVPVLVLGLISWCGLPDGQLHLRVLDIGQGDAILVEAPSGTTMLVDGGPDPELTLRQLGASRPFFARRVDVLVLTHPHADHLAGLFEILRRYEVGLILIGGRTVETAAEQEFLARARAEPDARLVAARSGMGFQLDARTRVTVLYPDAGDASAPLPDNDVNNGSVVLHLRMGAFDALLTGDAEAPVERMLLERGLLGRVEVLKVAHHGSHSGTTAPFLQALQPRLALISCGASNSYGHPHRETLDALAAVRGLALFRTDLDGAIEVTTDGQTYRLTSETGTVGPWSVAPIDWSAAMAGTIGR
jgi:competence protein ComEC